MNTLFTYEKVNETVELGFNQKKYIGKVVLASLNKAIVEFPSVGDVFFRLNPLDKITLFFGSDGNRMEIAGQIIRVTRDMSRPSISVCINRNYLEKWKCIKDKMIESYRSMVKDDVKDLDVLSI